MQVLVQVRGDFDPSDLWPYVVGSQTLASNRILTLEVGDSREFVSVLVALADRGVEILEAEVSADPRGID